jgi:hypothetical protein
MWNDTLKEEVSNLSYQKELSTKSREKEQLGLGQEVNSQGPGGSGGVQMSGPGATTATLVGLDTSTQFNDPMVCINQYGSNAAASVSLLSSLEKGKTSELIQSTQGLSGEDLALDARLELSVVEADGAQVSTETGSQLTEQASWLLDPLGEEGEMVETREGTEVKGAPADLQQEMSASISLAKGKRTKIVVVPEDKLPVRKSGRNKGAEANTPSMAKAQRLTAEKNLDRGNDFAILDLHSDTHLSSVVQDSCIVFVPSAGTPSEALSLIRAKEAVQAALAGTRFRLDREAATKAAGEAAAVAAAQIDSSAPSEGPAGPSGGAAVTGGESLAAAGPDAVVDTAAHEPGGWFRLPGMAGRTPRPRASNRDANMSSARRCRCAKGEGPNRVTNEGT